MMEHYEIPSQDSDRETVAVEMNNFSEADKGVVSICFAVTEFK